MITAIEVTNWKTHKNTTLSFQKGTNVLIGIMGAGKSSIMDAISFGLFGTFPALLSKRVSLTGLISNRPVHGPEAEVKLHFNVDDNEYIVTRKIGTHGASAKLEKNGAHFQTQPTKVTEEIENILKIDYDTFSRVVYSEQNRLDYFLELAKGERKKQIDHMLGLDSFATAEENATTLINNMKSSIMTEQETLERFDIKQLREQYEKVLEEKAAMEKEQEKLEKDSAKQKAELEKSKKQLDVLKKQFSTKKTVSDEIVKLQSKISTIKSEIKKIEALKFDVNELADKLSKLEKDAKSLSEELDELKKNERLTGKRVADIEANIKVNQKRITDRDRIMKEIKGEDESDTKKKLEQHNKELKLLTDEIASKKSKVEELKEWIKELDKHISKCPVCERDLPEELKKSILESKNNVIKSTIDEIKKAEASAEEKTSMIKKLTELQNRLILANSRLSEFKDVEKLLEKDEKELSTAKKDHAEIVENAEKKTKEHTAASEQKLKIKNDIQTAERKKSYEKDVIATSELLDQKTKEFDSIDVDEKAIYSLQDSITKESSALSETTSKLESSQKFLLNFISQAKEKDKQIKEFESIEKKMEKRQKQLINLNKFKVALIETEAILRNKLVSSINGLMQDLWPQLYPYGDYTSIRLDARKDDYLLEVNTNLEGNESWIQVDGVASGGERSIACLSMRIALAMVVVPNLKWLILDEPTHNIDATGISKLIQILGDALPNVVEQIFIITHDDNLRQINSAKVYELGRNKEANAPTTATEL